MYSLERNARTSSSALGHGVMVALPDHRTVSAALKRTAAQGFVLKRTLAERSDPGNESAKTGRQGWRQSGPVTPVADQSW